jgi:hypothetical protein
MPISNIKNKLSLTLIISAIICSLGWAKSPLEDGNTRSAKPKKTVRIFSIEQEGKDLYVSQSRNDPWSEGQITCIVLKLKNVPSTASCGVVKKTDKTAVVLESSPEIEAMQIEGSLKLSSEQKRTLSSIKESVAKERMPADWNVALGMSAGTNYLFSQLSFEGRISNSLTLGLMPLFITASGTSSKITAGGAFLTGTYYFNNSKSLTGIVGRLGLGGYSIKLNNGTSNSSSTSFGGMIYGGYRGDLGNGFTALAGAGAQYLKKSPGSSESIVFDGFLPMLTAEFGYRF